MKIKERIKALEQEVEQLKIQKKSLTMMLQVVVSSTENKNGLHETIDAILNVTNATE